MSWKNKKPIIIFLVLVLGTAGAAFLIVSRRSSAPKRVGNFQDCLQAGYFVIQSRPRQCKTPDGQVFIEEKKKETKTLKEEGIKSHTDPDQLIEVLGGEKFQISLGSNPTTGYRWGVETDTNLVTPIKQEFRPESDLLGAGGTEIFEFSASSSGETEIKFFYHRPWEEEPIETRMFKIKVF